MVSGRPLILLVSARNSKTVRKHRTLKCLTIIIGRSACLHREGSSCSILSQAAKGKLGLNIIRSHDVGRGASGVFLDLA